MKAANKDKKDSNKNAHRLSKPKKTTRRPLKTKRPPSRKLKEELGGLRLRRKKPANSEKPPKHGKNNLLKRT